MNSKLVGMAAPQRVTNAPTLRYGIFGVGRIGRVHAAMLLKQGHQVTCLGDEVAACASEARAFLELPESTPLFDTAQAMADAKLCDAVVVCSHTKWHARDSLPFIAANVPIYCEKPLTADLKGGFEFVSRVGDSPRLLQIGLQRRYDAALVYAKQLLDDGAIGELREIRSALRDQFPPPASYVSPGLIYDMGIHVADEVVWLTGEFPNRVWAHLLATRACPDAKDDGGNTAFVGFTTPSGIAGRLDLSRTHGSGYLNETYLIGSEGTMHVGRFCGYPGPIPVEVWRADGTKHPASKVFEMPELSKEQRKAAEFLPRFYDAYYTAHQEFQKAVKEKTDFGVTQIAALDAQVFVEAAQRSADKNGEVVELTRPDDIDEYAKVCESLGFFEERHANKKRKTSAK